MTGHGPQSCQDLHHDDLATYALGALRGKEAAELEMHLATCDACSERLRWLEPAVDLVPASVPQVEPSPKLGEGLMAIVREEAAAERAAEAAVARAPKAATATDRRRFSFRLPSFEGMAGMRPALAGLATLAIIAAGAGGYILGGDDSGDPATYAVAAVSPKSPTTGTVEINGGEGTLVVENLPPLPQDEVYQAWTAQGDNVQSASIFVPEKGGHAAAALPDFPEGTDLVMVTREPAGGSESATTAPLLTATID